MSKQWMNALCREVAEPIEKPAKARCDTVTLRAGLCKQSIPNIIRGKYNKYGGRYSIRTDDHIFVMNIVFPVNMETR